MNSISSNYISVKPIDHVNSSVDQCTDQYNVKVLNINNVPFETTSALIVNRDRSNKEVESNTDVYNTVHNNTLLNRCRGNKVFKSITPMSNTVHNHTMYNMYIGKLYDVVSFQCDSVGTFHRGGRVLHSQSCHSIPHSQGSTAYCDKVDFLCTHVSNRCSRLGALVFLHGCNGNQGRRGFYYLTGDGSLVECKALPPGILQVTLSTNLYIVFSQPVSTADKEMRLKAKITYENYHKDLHYQSVFKKSYDQHIDQVIRYVIHRQDCIVEKTCPAPGSEFVKHVTNPHTNTPADVIADFDAYVDQQVVHNAKVNKDFLIPSKTRDF